jgi:hypothetical protein
VCKTNNLIQDLVPLTLFVLATNSSGNEKHELTPIVICDAYIEETADDPKCSHTADDAPSHLISSYGNGEFAQ